MRTLNRILSPITIVFTSACASYPGWTPTVDSYNTSDEVRGRYSVDLGQCRELALQSSGGTPEKTVTGSVIGGLIGAAGGAAIGAVTGDPGAGAAIGAAAGGIGGGATQGLEAEVQYKRAYSKCMKMRGHRVID